MDAAETTDALTRFNTAPPARAAELAHGCLAVPAFAVVFTNSRPFPSADAAVARAEELARSLSWRQVTTALEAHPRIGDRVEGTSAEAAASRREQSGMSTADDELRTAMTEGNRAYEQRFGHVFLIRAAGRSAEEMLGELQRRLGNPPEAERAAVTEQLAQITALRVRALLS